MSLEVKIDWHGANFHLAIEATMHRKTTGLFGPSGAGKTSVLDVLAGIRRWPARVRLDGATLTDTAQKIFVPMRQRRIGYVPQSLALFPHLSVRQNLLYGCGNAQPDERFSFAHVVELLEIGALLERDIQHLSGGEAQRVALGRALLTGPRLLLLDEPLASLDAALKARVIPFLQRVRDEWQIPTLFVSHDAGEMVALCEEVLVLERGMARPLRATAEIFETKLEATHRFRSSPAPG